MMRIPMMRITLILGSVKLTASALCVGSGCMVIQSDCGWCGYDTVQYSFKLRRET